jgi:membrane protein implicated in regulation of membrane protease activity
MALRIGTQSYGFPQTWLGRVVGSVLAAALLVSALFFLFFFLLIAGVVILGISLRLLWRARQVRDQASKDVLEGEYSVESRDEATASLPADRTP